MLYFKWTTVKYQESYHLLLQFESTPVKFWKKQVCAKAQMDQFGGSCSQVSLCGHVLL